MANDKTQPRRTSDLNRECGTEAAIRRWLRNETDSIKPQATKLKRLRLLRAAIWFGFMADLSEDLR